MKHILKYILFLLLCIGFLPDLINAQQITQGEYFWDSDPGQGNAVQLTAYDGNFNDALETVVKNSASVPSIGMHTLNIRIKATDGNWSPVFTQIFSVEELNQTNASLKITHAEMFFDADPGNGNATQMLAFDGNFNDAIETVFKSGITVPAVGMHTINIRIKAADGNWGPLFTQVFSVEDLLQTNATLKITNAEMFFDTDPGNGNATQMLAFDGNFNDALETIVKSGITVPAVGMHTINIRIKAADGNWGPLFTQVFSVENLNQTNISLKIMQAELYWDNDPGEGNGTSMLAFDGNFNNAMETVMKDYQTNALSLGIHAFYVRVKAVDGNWGPAFGTIMNMDSSLVPVVAAINGQDVFCSNSNLNNISYSVIAYSGDTYLWYITGGTIVSGGTSNTVTVNWNSGAPTQEITIVQTNSFGNSVPVTKTITILSASFAYASNDTTICAGEPITLTAGGGNSYYWSNGQSTSSINVSPTVSSMYKVTVSNGTCSDFDTVIVSVIPLPIAPTASNNGPVAVGGTLSLTASTISGATYSWTGPNSFTSTLQNPTVSINATLAMDGTYSVIATINGCSSTAATTLVDIIPTSTDSACGTQEFNDGFTAPAGWLFTGIASVYTGTGYYGNSAPAVKFDNSNDVIETAPVNDVSQLSFWIKGVGTDATSALLVEGYNGTSWVTVENITNLPTTGTTKTYISVSAYSKFKFTYTKSGGNLGFDDVNIICGSTVGLTEMLSESNINIYPNPTNKELNIEFELQSSENVNIVMLNSLNQQIFTESIKNFSGLYANKHTDGFVCIRELERDR